MRVVAFLFFLFLGQWVFAQVSITVVDKDTNEPLIAAYVVVESDEGSLSLSTNEDGTFILNSDYLPAKLIVSYLGYNSLEYTLTEENPEGIVITLEIDELNIAVNPIIIANPFLSNDISFNRKEFQVLPGAYEDPSRLLLKAPGFSTANDQANSILYKGFPSNLINWNINGGLIVNPNHLSNAGTLSDASSANAGGVNMISGQVIGKYDFQSSPYNLPGNNAIAGNSNIEFSQFNNSYLNLSLVGLEAGYGFSGKKLPGAQFNYRYSTVGILTGVLGLDFGGENIVYQDLFSKIDLIDKEGEKLSLHLTAGISHNYKDSIAVRDSAEFYKDVENIYFDSQILIGGLNYEKDFKEVKFIAVLNVSKKTDARESSGNSPFKRTVLDISQQITSGLFKFKRKAFNFGLSMHHIQESKVILRSITDETSLTEINFSNTNMMPYFNIEKQRNWLYYSLGSGLTYNSATSNFYLEPHAKVIANLSKVFEAELSFRRNSQLIPASNFSYEFDPREMLGLHFEASLRMNTSKFNAFVNVFNHHMNQILVEEGSYYSQFTAVDRFNIGKFNYSGQASVKGTSIGLSTRNVFIRNLNLNANASFFTSDYSTGVESDKWSNNTFDFSKSLNFLMSYQRNLSKDREWVTSFSAHVRGGLNEFNIDQEASNNELNVVFDFQNGAENRLPNYTRMDFRIVYNLRKGIHRRFAKSISLDIQNLANRENDAFTNIDFLTNQPFVQKQLGLIPILAYRIEF